MADFIFNSQNKQHCKENQEFIQNFIVGGGGKCERWPVVPSQMLLCVVKMCSFFIKCINEETKCLSSERMMLYITKS